MKKLMVAIAAVASAFGLYADDLNNQIDFKNSYLEVGETLDVTKDDAGNEAEGSTRGWYSATPEETGLAALDETLDQKVLAVDNSSPLYRTVVGNDGTLVPQEIDDSGIFFDTTVKFTVGEATATPTIEDGAKLAIWVGGDEEADTPYTNLFVTAGSIADDTITATNFTVELPANFDFNGWHRVTIRTIKQAVQGQDVPGFVIFVDENAVACADADYADKIGAFTPSSAAKEFLDNNKLFLSLVSGYEDYSQEFSGVGFKGSGSLAKVGITDYANAPEFARGAKVFALGWDAGVTGFTANGEVISGLTDAGTTNLVLTSGNTIEVTGVAYAEGYMPGEWENGETEDGVDGTFTYVAGSVESGNIGVARIAFTINGKPYASFEDALDAAIAAGKPTTITLAADLAAWDGEVEIDQGDITLDLAGNTIEVADYDDYDLFYVTDGKLTVIDSIGDGAITVTGLDGSSYTGIFTWEDDGIIIIGADDDDEGVTINGILGTVTTIYKGEFDQENNDDDDLKEVLPEGDEYEIVDAGDYWKVQKKGGPEPTFVIQIVGGKSYETIDAALADAKDGDELQLLKSVTLGDTLVIDKAITFEMDGKEIKLAADKAIGIDVQAAATIQDGDITSTRETYANNAYMILNEAVNATYKNLNIYAANYKFGLTCDSPGDLADECENAPTVTVTCENVDILGNGTLFYAQHTILNLDAYCSATKDPTLTSGGYAAAVYSALNATVTLAGDDKTGGAYEHDYALISGNLGGKIFVNGGEFKGNIKSYMKVGAHPELEEYDGYQAEFHFNGGTYDGEIVFEDDSDEARELDYFVKADDVELDPPAGYRWDDVTGVLEKIPTTWTVTVNLDEDITAVATNKTQGGEAKFFAETGSFTVNDGDNIAVYYTCAVPGYEPSPSQVSMNVIDNENLIKAKKRAIKYTITYNDYGEWAEGFTPVTKYAVTNETFSLPNAENIKPRDGGTFGGWTNELGVTVSEVKTGTTGNLAFYAVWEKVTPGSYPDDWPKTDADTKAKFADWVATKGADADLSTVDAKDAFLLNCAVKDLKDAKDAFKITSIEFVEGEWVIGEPEGDFNGKVVTKAFDAVVDGKEVTEPTGEETELFWKAFLVFPTAE